MQKPNGETLNATSVDILNAIRNNATENYRANVPSAQGTLESIREIGNIIMSYAALKNEFLSALVNRIGMVLITSKMYDNPLAVFKKGKLDLGETIEEIFVEIAKVFQYDPGTAESEVFKREIPDVEAAFHTMNYQKFYKATIQDKDLKLAFLSWTGVSDLIAKIVNSMYSAASYDEYQVMLFMLALFIDNGYLYPVQVSSATAANAKSIATKIKQVSNQFEFMTDKYNAAGVHTFSMKEDQYLLVNADFDAIMDVEVLASAFNMTKAEFMGHRVLVNSFGDLDLTRIQEIFANDPNFSIPSGFDDVLEAYEAIPAVLVDRNFFMIFDNLYEFTEQYNGQGLYWNYWYHVWKTFSGSPFANAVVFVPGAPGITSVTVTPSSQTYIAGEGETYAGKTFQFGAEVVATWGEAKTVTWSVTGAEASRTATPVYATVDATGLVTLTDAVDDATNYPVTITVTATSTADSTVYGTATLVCGQAAAQGSGSVEPTRTTKSAK